MGRSLTFWPGYQSLFSDFSDGVGAATAPNSATMVAIADPQYKILAHRTSALHDLEAEANQTQPRGILRNSRNRSSVHCRTRRLGRLDTKPPLRDSLSLKR
jgi:hypothetical protein